METVPAAAPEPTDDRAARLSFFVRTPLQLATRIQAKLGIDELTYLHVAAPAHTDARAYFLFGVLDEVVKAAVAAMRWQDLLGDAAVAKDPKFSEGDRSRIARQVLASTASDQAMWFRRLIEILVDLVLFSSTNDQDFYRCFLAAKSVASGEDARGDVEEFFGCEIENAAHGLRQDRDNLRAIAGRVAVGRAWFLKAPPGPDGSIKGNQGFSSFRSRFKMAHAVATPSDRLLLGASYVPAYATPSKLIHWTVGDSSRSPELRDVEVLLTHIGLLGLRVCHLVEDLFGDSQASLSMGTRQALELSDIPRLYAARFQQKFDVGDIVLVDGAHVCQVVETKQSKYGNTSFRCRFLGRPPIPSISLDWCPSPGVQRIYRRADLLPKLRQHLENCGAPQLEVERIAQISDAEVCDLLTRVFTEFTASDVLPSALWPATNQSREK